MSRPLREELERIAERAPVAEGPADTWERARRSVRRDALAVVAAVAAVVALVTGALAWLPDRAEVAPAEGDYFDAPYREISAGGVTFQLTQTPNFESLVIALGNPARPTLLTASVVRVQTMVQSGKIMYLVGCRFTGRLTRIEG